jgi:hypothetical protein
MEKLSQSRNILGMCKFITPHFSRIQRGGGIRSSTGVTLSIHNSSFIGYVANGHHLNGYPYAAMDVYDTVFVGKQLILHRTWSRFTRCTLVDLKKYVATNSVYFLSFEQPTFVNISLGTALFYVALSTDQVSNITFIDVQFSNLIITATPLSVLFQQNNLLQFTAIRCTFSHTSQFPLISIQPIDSYTRKFTFQSCNFISDGPVRLYSQLIDISTSRDVNSLCPSRIALSPVSG